MRKTLWSRRTPRKNPHRTVLTLLLTLAMASTGTTIATPATAARPDKIDKKVVEQATKAEQVTVWVILRDKADLRAANRIHDRAARGAFVLDRLKNTAEQSQRGLRAHLTKRGVNYQSYWVMNAIRITADLTLIREISADPNVERVLPNRTYQIPTPEKVKKPKAKTKPPAPTAVEWNIDRIRAPQVWSTFGVHGEGIVVANIDTGVQYDHPALVNQYRGNQGGGTFDHNYNWYDPSNICGSPSLAPCDNVGHGTHTMGTMVGDDGTNQIGVAPGARWIAAKGCESTSCSSDALLASGQWILAPTDLTGNNPRPDLRPHIVNNSWGSFVHDPFYQSVVTAWLASGIFPAFSNGNRGPECATSSSPGDYVDSYSAGAFDIDNAIADFSSRGPAGDETKPNIAAPGVAIRSSFPTSTYASLSGTSMASPHVAGTVALIWSAASGLISDVPATRTLLDNTAIDVSDLTCGGTPGDNNVWGEGRLDAFAAVEAAPRVPTGTLQGTITNTGTGDSISGAEVRAVGPVDWTTSTGPDGRYSFTDIPVGAYDLTATAFGFQPATANDVTVREGETTVQNLALTPIATHVVTGHVRDGTGDPIPNATVSLVDTAIPAARTDAAGVYRFPSVPEGEYDVRAEAGNCNRPQQLRLVVNSDEILDFALPRISDTFGYHCQIATPGYIEAGTVLPLTGDDASVPVTLPFPVTFYGQTYRTAHVSTNGVANFLAPYAGYWNTSIPDPAAPNAAVYPFWDDLYVDDAASVRTQASGTAPNRTFVIEWRNVAFLQEEVSDFSRRVDFEIVLQENGRIRFEYRNIGDDDQERGNSATIGIENANGTDALQYSYNEAVIDSPTFALLLIPPPGGFVQGTVTDANDHLPIGGATVNALQGTTLVRSTTTHTDGTYRMALPLGTYTIQTTATNYATATATVVIATQDQTVTSDFALRTARGTVSPTALEIVLPLGLSRARTLTLSNTGTVNMSWQYSDPVPWLYALSPTTGTLAPGASHPIQVVVNAAGLTAGTYDTTITIATNSGRQPNLTIPVRMVVSDYFVGVNSGGYGYTDSTGDYWWADQAYRARSWGYTNTRSTTARTSHAISGTTDDLLYQDLRTNPVEYRFDGLPAGVYEIDLRFAEITNLQPNTRLADIVAENKLLLPALDITNEVGDFAADQHVFYVRVTDGQLNLRFVERYAFSVPIVNAIQVVHRPDK